MAEALKLYFLITNPVYINDGIRSALGQSVENHYSYACIFYVKMPEMSDYLKENIEYMRDLEGDVLAVVDTMDEETRKYNVEECGLTPITLEELAQKLKEADAVIGYGMPLPKTLPDPACVH